jgi:site-specific DNA-methyltransferase (adenine-specific)
MIFNVMDWPRDNESEKIHPTQKPIELLKTLIEIFTDVDDVVIDPCAGSGTTLLAANQCNRKSYGFEIKKEFVKLASEWDYSNCKRLCGISHSVRRESTYQIVKHCEEG